MKHSATRFIPLLILIGLTLISCKDTDKNTNPPLVELISGENLINNDTSVAVAASLNFKVHCKWNGDNALTNFIVSNNGIRIIDEGMNTQEFERDVTFAKDTCAVNLIVFTIRDIKGGSASVSLTINKDDSSVGGELVWYHDITLDAQNATDAKSFLSLTNGVAYTMQDAFGIQGDIHILYYFDFLSGEGNVISSPGANIDNSVYTGDYGLSNWTTKNTTRFYPVNLTQGQFEAITDPVYVVGLYSEADGKRKAKNLAVGDTYSFKVESTSKYGVLRVYQVDGQDSGSVVFTVAMQK